MLWVLHTLNLNSNIEIHKLEAVKFLKVEVPAFKF